jgi:hypothetical protein
MVDYGTSAFLAGLIGVAATLLGSFTTYLFQGRSDECARSFERDERLRYEQVDACSAFASAMTELKRGLITLWFYHQRDAAGADYLAARIECHRLVLQQRPDTSGSAGVVRFAGGGLAVASPV